MRSYMAHHQGMSLLSIADLLLDHPLQRRFASDPQCQATLMLLHERIPKAAPFLAHPAESPLTHAAAETAVPQIRVITRPDTHVPEVQLLSNGRYHVLVTAAGSGYSRWNDMAVTRWQEDPTRDHWGSFCYIRDTATGAFWSNTAQPVPQAARPLRSGIHRGKSGVPSAGSRRGFAHRDPHRNRGLPRGRHRAAPHPAHQSVRRAAHGGDHQLRRSRPGGTDVRRAAPGLQQAVRADRDRAVEASRAVHAPVPGARRTVGLAVSPDGGLGRRDRRDVLRNGSCAVRRPRADPRPPAGTRRSWPALRHPGLGTGSCRGDPSGRHPRAGRDGHDRPADRRGRCARDGGTPDRSIPGPTPGRPGLRSGVDAQPGRAAAVRHLRGRRRRSTSALQAR